MALWVAKTFWEKNWKVTSPNILNRRPTETPTHWQVGTHQRGSCCAASHQMLLHIPKYLRALQSPSWPHLLTVFCSEPPRGFQFSFSCSWWPEPRSIRTWLCTRQNKEEVWKVLGHPALAGNRTRVSRVGGENSTTEPPMLCHNRHFDSSPERISTITNLLWWGNKRLPNRCCLWKIELTDWKALKETANQAIACGGDNQMKI